MAGEKAFSADTPDQGEQRSPVELKRAFETDILSWINGIYANTGDIANANKALLTDGLGNFFLNTILRSALDLNIVSGDEDDGKVLFISDLAQKEISFSNALLTGFPLSLAADGIAGQALVTNANGTLGFQDFTTSDNPINFAGSPSVGDLLIATDTDEVSFFTPQYVDYNNDPITFDSDGNVGQIFATDGNGTLTPIDPPASSTFVDVAGNINPAVNNANYSIDGGITITIDDADVVPGFSFKFQPKNGVDFSATPPIISYNGVNAFENTYTEDVNVNVNAEWECYSQDGTNLEFKYRGVTSG